VTSRFARRLVLAALFALAACHPFTPGTAQVNGVVECAGAGVESATVSAAPMDGESVAAAATTSGYHGAFVLRLAPGRWRLRGNAVLRGERDRPARGEVEIEVPAGVRRIDRVTIRLTF
jgi:hypothetical protein